MNPIDATFRRLRADRHKAFIPFIPAGDPDLGATERLVQEVARRGASLVEIGFPYSDPIADGPAIQASYTRALERGLRMDDVYACLHRLSSSTPSVGERIPLVGMVSYSLIHRAAPREFLRRAHEAGLSGAIVPDLPVDEADELAQMAGALDFKIIQLVTPTTPRQRAVRIARASTGFLYCVSVTGITGERDCLPAELLEQLRFLRQETDLPLCVGFGISRTEQIRMLRETADAVIVGSALVRRLEQFPSRPLEEIIREIGDLVQALASALECP